MPDRTSFFEHETWTAGVIGLGYVGLPLAVNAVQRGLRAVGFDVDPPQWSACAPGIRRWRISPTRPCWPALAAGLEVTADESAPGRADALFICVPSPLNRHREPDMTYIEAAAGTVSRVARPGMLVSLESTTYPGTTEDLVVPGGHRRRPAPRRGGVRLLLVGAGGPGRNRELGSIPKVVGGVSPASTRVAGLPTGGWSTGCTPCRRPGRRRCPSCWRTPTAP